MSGAIPEKSLMQVITQTIDTFTTDGKNYDALINVLSLICLITILNRNHSQPSQVTATAAGNPLQKLLGELTKGDGHSGGPSPDMLMSLLPLLNNPQLKSKLNPSNIAAIMGLVNSMGGNTTEKQEQAKPEKNTSKTEIKQDDPTAATVTTSAPVTPAAAVTTSAESPANVAENEDADRKGLGRYLNWKTNF